MAEPVAIVGGGAIGQLMAGLLAQQGIEAVIIGRPGSHNEVRAHQLTTLEGERFHHKVRHLTPDALPPSQALLVTTKAYQAQEAATPLLSKVTGDTPIVLLHNGLGPQQTLARDFPEHNWWAGTLTDGALRQGQGAVKHTGLGQRFAGSLRHRGPLPEALAAIGFERDDNIELRLWHKLAVNALINPLTALHRCPNGELTQARYLPTLTRLSDELARVAASQGVPMEAQEILALGLKVAEATAQNRSSMLSDVEAGRPTEIEAISGFVVALADDAGIEVPTHRDNLDRVRALRPS
ncbi:2-dehydropantoate 2-reductase [Ferrimonas sp. YFM]|uniref:ketopantoate reductase family protein n=1 Tax=Ferrimonas sp. YFM TaxID=3028878 RepID=UPI002573EAAC|nr:2-dehydropantoate 2-reductase [Ferrimonas sp. YFM]BDY03952.1 2-dehydropantoate 2-reductase [Ferrimonas sp. YFM]